MPCQGAISFLIYRIIVVLFCEYCHKNEQPEGSFCDIISIIDCIGDNEGVWYEKENSSIAFANR